MRSLFLALLLSLPLAPLHADDQATSQYLSLDTRLLAKPAAFAKSLGKLKKGMLVHALAPKNGYVKVQVDLGDESKTGYLPLRALQKSKPKLTASTHTSSDASSEEVAAATKGFNKQVEADLRDKDTKGGYDKLDKGLERSTVEDPRGSTEAFREKGKLGEFKEGGE